MCCYCYLLLQYLRDSGLIHVPDKERCVVVVVIYDFSTYVIVVLSMFHVPDKERCVVVVIVLLQYLRDSGLSPCTRQREVCCYCYLLLQYLRDSGLIHVPDKERCVVVVVIYDFSTYVIVVLSMYQTKRGVLLLLLLLLFTTSVLT